MNKTNPKRGVWWGKFGRTMWAVAAEFSHILCVNVQARNECITRSKEHHTGNKIPVTFWQDALGKRELCCIGWEKSRRMP
eukprot:3165929-Amphidinium_carterae.1